MAAKVAQKIEGASLLVERDTEGNLWKTGSR